MLPLAPPKPRPQPVNLTLATFVEGVTKAEEEGLSFLPSSSEGPFPDVAGGIFLKYWPV